MEVALFTLIKNFFLPPPSFLSHYNDPFSAVVERYFFLQPAAACLNAMLWQN